MLEGAEAIQGVGPEDGCFPFGQPGSDPAEEPVRDAVAREVAK